MEDYKKSVNVVFSENKNGSKGRARCNRKVQPSHHNEVSEMHIFILSYWCDNVN
jgi:hypothetical protein